MAWPAHVCRVYVCRVDHDVGSESFKLPLNGLADWLAAGVVADRVSRYPRAVVPVVQAEGYACACDAEVPACVLSQLPLPVPVGELVYQHGDDPRSQDVRIPAR